MFDGKLLGFVAIGDAIYFRGLHGPDTIVTYLPEDVDGHRLVATLNGIINLTIEQVRSQSEFKF